MDPSNSHFLETLRSADTGDDGLLDRLFSSFYEELHRHARRELRRGVPVTLGPTTLLHETFLSISQRESLSFPDQQRFLAYASRAMRGLIVDYFRARRSHKRGGLVDITSLPTNASEIPQGAPCDEVVHLGDALETLSAVEPRLAECVELKFFCGLSFGEIAEVKGVSERTVQRDWDKARLLLSNLIHAQGEGPPRQADKTKS